MIIRKLKETIAITRKDKVVTEVRKGLQIVWQAVRSCFGSGIWRGEKPWLGGEKWRGSKQ